MEPRIERSGADRSVEVQKTEPFASSTLQQLESEFLEGLKTLDDLAAQRVDPFELVRQEAPKLAATLRQMAGVEPNEAFSSQIDQTADRLMTDLQATTDVLRKEIAELQEDPSRAITDMLVQLAIMSSTGHLAPEDYQMMVGILATQQERIAADMIRSYDDRIRKVQAESLEWYRRYNLAKAQQNAPFIQFATESLRSGTRLTKMHMDQLNDVFDRHLRLARLRLDALQRGHRIALDQKRFRQTMVNDWMRMAIQVGRFTSMLDDTDPASQATRRRYWAMFAHHTERLREHARQQGYPDLYPELNDTDIATLSMAINPQIHLTQIMTQRGSADIVNLQYQALRNRAEIERINNEIAVGGNYERIQRQIRDEEIRVFQQAPPTNFNEAVSRVQGLYEGYLTLAEVSIAQLSQLQPVYETGAPFQASGRVSPQLGQSARGARVDTSRNVLNTARNNVRSAVSSAVMAVWNSLQRWNAAHGSEGVYVRPNSANQFQDSFIQRDQNGVVVANRTPAALHDLLNVFDTYREAATDPRVLRRLQGQLDSEITKVNGLLHQLLDPNNQNQPIESAHTRLLEMLQIVHETALQHRELARRLYETAKQRGIRTDVDPQTAADRAYLETMHEFLSVWGYE